jgi:glucan phosphoethanolaminetransferase (alkaline phosphatase superfamily)
MTQQPAAKDKAMLNSDRLIGGYRRLVSLTAFAAIAYCFLVFVSTFTSFSFPRSLRLLHPVLVCRAFMLLTEMTIFSRFLRDLSEASRKPELAWLGPEPTAWAAAIVVLVASSIASLQQHEPVSWSVGVAFLFVSWLRTLRNTCRQTQQLVLNDDEQATLKELRDCQEITD